MTSVDLQCESCEETGAQTVEEISGTDPLLFSDCCGYESDRTDSEYADEDFRYGCHGGQ